MSSVLDITVKRHKQPGSIKVRNIHASSGYSLLGLSQWVSFELRSTLKKLKHILKDSFDLAQRLDGITLPTCSAYCVQIDVADFFLSGTADEIEKDIMTLFDPSSPKYPIFRDALRLLLTHQFVRLPDFAMPDARHHVYQVVKGTGMGLPHSGEVSDAALYARMERGLLNESTYQIHGILHYFRFKDDILLICSQRGAPGTQGFFQIMKQRAGYYKLTCDNVGRNVRFLELNITIQDNYVRYSHALKPHAFTVPLSPLSAHHPSVHKGWPKAVVKRVQSLS
eukprot:880771-Karenia_brevis.AAC.1